MNVAYSRYELRPRRRTASAPFDGPRRGTLLRVEAQPGRVGYADLHPWPELGDATLDEQLAAIARGAPMRLGMNALTLAGIDAEARAEGRAAGEGLEVPPSHRLLDRAPEDPGIADDIENSLRRGFDRVKIKSRGSPDEARALSGLASRFGSVRFRLDFGGGLDADGLAAFERALGEAVEAIDFIEDPTPWDPASGFPASGVRLALDRDVEVEGTPARLPDVLVLKPAARDAALVVDRARAWNRPLVVTSYLDHPLGQVAAAWAAARLLREPGLRVDPCGLLSHEVYEPNAFSGLLETRGPRLLLPREPGFGFGDLLRRQRWIPLGDSGEPS